MPQCVKGQRLLISDALSTFTEQYKKIYAELLCIAESARDHGDYDQATNALVSASGVATAMYAHALQAEQLDKPNGHHTRTQELEDLGDEEDVDVDVGG